VHLLIGEIDEGLDCDDLSRLHGAGGTHHVVRCEPDEMPGKTSPLIANSRFLVDGFAGVGSFFVCVTGS
jgi:hypothetical protein